MFKKWSAIYQAAKRLNQNHTWPWHLHIAYKGEIVIYGGKIDSLISNTH